MVDVNAASAEFPIPANNAGLVSNQSSQDEDQYYGSKIDKEKVVQDFTALSETDVELYGDTKTLDKAKVFIMKRLLYSRNDLTNLSDEIDLLSNYN